MRRTHYIWQAEKRIFGCRLSNEHVECGPCNLPAFERFIERRLVYETAARAIDDPHALFHGLDCRGIDDIAGLVGEWRMQRDEVGPFEQFIELDLFNTKVSSAVG